MMIILLILVVGFILVRLCAKITEEWDEKLTALISTGLAILLGIWALCTDVNTFEDALEAVLFVPALLGVGSSLIAVTLGWQTDNGIWSESFRVGNTSFGHKTGTLTLTGMIFIVLVAASIIYLVIWAFSGQIAIYIYFGMHAIILLKALFKKD